MDSKINKIFRDLHNEIVERCKDQEIDASGLAISFEATDNSVKFSVVDSKITVYKRVIKPTCVIHGDFEFLEWLESQEFENNVMDCVVSICMHLDNLDAIENKSKKVY